MPVLKVKTVDSREVWVSPDGQRRIHDLQLEYEGKPVKAQTFSDAIAVVGWEGEVETYERPNKKGIQTFVKQPPKEDGYPFQKSTGGGSSKPAYVPKDEKGIQAMWAIDKAKDLVIAVGFKAKITQEEILGNIETLAQELFAMVPRVKATPLEVAASETPNESESPVEPDVVHDPDQVAIEDIKDVFDEAEKKAEEVTVEDPWQPN